MTIPEWVTGHAEDCEVLFYGPADSMPPCNCGHSQIKVWVHPAPAGEGVLCESLPGCFAVFDKRLDLWREVDARREDAPIREAWERLCSNEAMAAAVMAPTVAYKPPNGLYLYLDSWDWEQGVEVQKSSAILPIEDVTEEWQQLEPREHPRPRNLARHLKDKHDAQSLRFSAPGKEWWYPDNNDQT